MRIRVFNNCVPKNKTFFGGKTSCSDGSGSGSSGSDNGGSGGGHATEGLKRTEGLLPGYLTRPEDYTKDLCHRILPSRACQGGGGGGGDVSRRREGGDHSRETTGKRVARQQRFGGRGTTIIKL